MNQNGKTFSSMVGRKIRKLRLERGYTGGELAKLLLVSQQQVSRYENGLTVITVDLLCKISEILNVNIYYFLDDFSSPDEISDLYNSEKFG